MPDLRFEFVAPVLQQDEGLRFHYLPLPDDVVGAFDRAGVRRVVAVLNGTPFRRAIMRTDEHGPHLVTGQIILREIGARLGEPVMIELSPDPEPDLVEVPEELEVALDQDEEAAERFYAFSPGKQRSLALYVSQAKRVETRVKRAVELAYKLRTRTLYGDRD